MTTTTPDPAAAALLPDPFDIVEDVPPFGPGDRRPLDIARQLELLEQLSDGGDPALAELLDHALRQLDHLVEFVDAFAPTVLGLMELGEQLQTSGPLGLIGLLSGPA